MPSAATSSYPPQLHSRLAVLSRRCSGSRRVSATPKLRSFHPPQHALTLRNVRNRPHMRARRSLCAWAAAACRRCLPPLLVHITQAPFHPVSQASPSAHGRFCSQVLFPPRLLVHLLLPLNRHPLPRQGALSGRAMLRAVCALRALRLAAAQPQPLACTARWLSAAQRHVPGHSSSVSAAAAQPDATRAGWVPGRRQQRRRQPLPARAASNESGGGMAG